MDARAKSILESAVHRTLHAHSFSRSSSQASLVLTDLLARYLTLLTSTCTKYAQHAGRSNLVAQDAFSVLDELGVSMRELEEYGSSEGAELGRYAVSTARRMDELREFRLQLNEGLRRERDDAFGLVYVPISDTLLSEESEDEELDGVEDTELIDTELTNGKHNSLTESKPSQEPTSPISPRPLPSQLPPLKIERPSSPLLQPSTPTYASDYFTSVSYSQSSLSSMPEWHLPPRPPRAPQQPLVRLPTLQTQPALLAAYHHILTHPPPANATLANPSRHKVAMALLSLTQNSPRWETPDTLYSSSAPCPPRITSIGPTYPIPLGENPHDPKTAADAERDRKTNLPPLPPRPVFGNERITSLITQQSSRIPDLARHVLPWAVHSRSTRLSHPPPLTRDRPGGQPQRLLYGTGVNAPWNIGSSATAPTPTIAKPKDHPTPNGMPNGKDDRSAPIPDARLHATWDYEAKRYNDSLPMGRRGRMGSMSGLTLNIGGRGQ